MKIFRLTLLFIALVIFFALLVIKNIEDKNEETYNKEERKFINKAMFQYQLNSSFNGILTDFYIDKNNKGAFTLRISDNNTKESYPMYYMGNFNHYLNIGDSIVKPEGKLEIFIFKGELRDSLIHHTSPYDNCD